MKLERKDIIEKILPVVDNFERGLDAVKEEDKKIRSFREWRRCINICLPLWKESRLSLLKQ